MIALSVLAFGLLGVAFAQIQALNYGSRGRHTSTATGIAQSQYYSGSKEFMEAGKKRLTGAPMREANTDEVKGLRKETRDLKEVVAEQALELRLLKKSMTGDGGDDE